jgi:S-adenosylmethionine:tRNA ribosyltransferase-isomerase
MRASDFDFDLPDGQIAQHPAPERDGARLYLLPRAGGAARHAAVRDLPSLLPEGALLIVNDTRVVPARVRGRKASGGRVELLLLERLAREGDGETWRCLGGASKPIRPGQSIALDGARAEVLATSGREVEARIAVDGGGEVAAWLERAGEVPLPPYIAREGAPPAEDRARYQTVYARAPGSAAAPTAGLHLSARVLAELEARGVQRAAVTLHVGLGTFAPLAGGADAELESIDGLHAERFRVPDETARAFARARAERRPVIAVGTTVVRTLESALDGGGALSPGEGSTRLFIRPGHRFRAVDGMLTNFHLPRSSLLVLVSAFAGRERVLAAYADAVRCGYRFFSFGDAMLIS